MSSTHSGYEERLMSDNKVISFSTDTHPFALYLDAFTDIPEAPEYVVDDVFAAGAVCVAGERGLGKTSLLVPLMLAPTGLLRGYPLTASIRRKVVYIAEDAAQVRRIISAMREDGLINADGDEFNDWFRLVEAKRLKAAEIVKAVPYYDDLWTPNQKVDGSTYLAPPVVVLDTTNATIDLDNISDNSEVSDAVATLRQNFGAICLVLVGHVAKASRGDAKQLTFIGAGSWEGDTQQSIYLASENDQRYMILGKKRFESETTEYLIKSYVSTFQAEDKLGRLVEINCFYGVPEASSVEVRDAAKQERDADAQKAARMAVQSRVIEYISKHPSCGKREIMSEVTGKSSSISEAVAVLVEVGRVVVKKDGQTDRHNLAEGKHGETPEGSDYS